MELTQPILKHYAITTLVYLALAGVVASYVFTAISTIQVAAVMLLTFLLIAIGLIPYSKAIVKLQEEMLSTSLSRPWLAMLIWTIIATWVLYAVVTKSGF